MTYNWEHISNGEGRCRANDGEPCEQCQRAWDADYAYWRGQWEIAPLSERDPKAYAEQMRDAGRGHLLKETKWT